MRIAAGYWLWIDNPFCLCYRYLPMNAYTYKKDRLFVEDTPIDLLADKYGTPLYVYSRNYIIDQFRSLTKAMREVDPLVCYSMKANSNAAIVRMLVDEGSGLDIVSGGELYRALKAGADPSKIVFAGVGKTEAEIAYALENKILFFTVESEPEIERIQQIASGKKITARIALRVNPDVDAKTLKYTTTGKKENKFGIEIEAVKAIAKRADAMSNVEVAGLHVHIGSQILAPEPFVDALERIKPLCLDLKDTLPGFSYLDIGGGVGIKYEPDHEPLLYSSFAEKVIPILKEIGLKTALEPGRSLVGNSGALVCRVQYVKEGSTKKFIVVDAGMNDLIRPSLYDAYQEILPAKAGNDTMTADVVGPICESGDFFAKSRKLATVKQGDFLSVMSSGAYGFTMASTYNSRPLPAEVIVDGSSHRLIRKRQSLEDMIKDEII